MVWLLPSLQGNCNDFLGAAGPDRWDVSLLGYLHRLEYWQAASVHPEGRQDDGWDTKRH